MEITGNRYRWRAGSLRGKIKRLLFLFEDPLEGYVVLHVKLFFILYDFTWDIFEFKF